MEMYIYTVPCGSCYLYVAVQHWNMASAHKELVLKFDLVLDILNLYDQWLLVLDSTTLVFSGEGRKAEITIAEVLGNLLQTPWLTTIIIHLNYCRLGIIIPFWKGCSQAFIFPPVRSFGNDAFNSISLGFRWPLPLFPGSRSLFLLWFVRLIDWFLVFFLCSLEGILGHLCKLFSRHGKT